MNKKINIDVARFVVSFLVIAIHISPFININQEFNFFFTRILGRIAVPLFFMITGYFVIDGCLKDKNKLKKYTINDIKTVIDKKTSEWINNTKMKPYLTPETLHDILDKTKTVKNNYYLSILEQMKKDGYLKLGVEPLLPEQEDRNYGKSIKWIERGIIPGFLLEDMQKYINKSSNKLNGNDKKYLE